MVAISFVAKTMVGKISDISAACGGYLWVRFPILPPDKTMQLDDCQAMKGYSKSFEYAKGCCLQRWPKLANIALLLSPQLLSFGGMVQCHVVGEKRMNKSTIK